MIKNYHRPTLYLLIVCFITLLVVQANAADMKGKSIKGFNHLKFGMTVTEAKKVHSDLELLKENIPYEDPSYGPNTTIYYRNIPHQSKNKNKKELQARTIGEALLENVYYFFKKDKFMGVRGISEHKLTVTQMSARETLDKKYRNALQANTKIGNIEDEEMLLCVLSEIYKDEYKKLYKSIISKYGIGEPSERNETDSFEIYTWMVGKVFIMTRYADCLKHDVCGFRFVMDDMSIISKELEF